MEYILKTTLIGLLFGTLGTTIGGIIGINLKNSSKLLSIILEFAAGLMTGIVCFDLIPEALKLSDLSNLLFGLLIGISVMLMCESIVNKQFIKKEKKGLNSLAKTGTIIGIGLAIHNFPEGLAIGSGFFASNSLGLSLAIAIALHDIPEGVAIAAPMKSGGENGLKALIITIISGLTTGLGAFIGAILGGISKEAISLCLALAAGAMLYIISGEIIPESKQLYKGRITSLGNILGFAVGLLVSL